jgi:hypothetical protein
MVQHQEEQMVQEEQLDWRDQLYHWAGEVAYDQINMCLAWKGAWMASMQSKRRASALPDANSILAWGGGSTFEYYGPTEVNKSCHVVTPMANLVPYYTL